MDNEIKSVPEATTESNQLVVLENPKTPVGDDFVIQTKHLKELIRTGVISTVIAFAVSFAGLPTMAIFGFVGVFYGQLCTSPIFKTKE